MLGPRHLSIRSTNRPHRRAGGGWRLVLAAGVLAAVGFGGYTLLGHQSSGSPSPGGIVVVQDAYSGAPLPGAQVTLLPLRCADTCVPMEMTPQGAVARQFGANRDGEIHARIVADRVAVSVAQGEYEGVQRELAWPPAQPAALALRPTWVTGRITALGKPLAQIRVQAQAPGREQSASTTTDADGRYRLTGVPEGASLIVDAPNISRRPHPLDRRTTFDLALRPDVLTGTVRDTQGKPVGGVTVSAGAATAHTDATGAYMLDGVDEGATVTAKGIGYLPQQQPLGAELTRDLTLRPFTAKGIYVQAPTAADPVQFGKLMDQVSKSELNTFVVDLKDNNGFVYYDTKVPLAREVGAVHPILDVPKMLKTLHDRNLYAIARIVVMEDPVAAVKRPDLAITDTRTGKPWRTDGGQPWLNPTNPRVWQYATDLAVEAANLGFDEIQFDYVRFPSDGALNTTEYGPGFTGGEEQRKAAIHAGLSLTHERLLPTRALFGADIFGITAWLKGDNGIGQQFEDLAALVDVICPMDYPSHFGRNFNDWDIPNNYPYDVITQSLTKREGRVPGIHAKTRPWLQAFTYGPGRAYGTAEIFAQIQACNEAGSAGYLLWNVGSDYQPGWLPPRPVGNPAG